MTNYNVWSVQKLLESELAEVRNMYEQTLDPERATMLEQVVKYLEMRLDGTIQ
jgi:cystathionine beta-lyase/cystathionine gamma-synthase